jgi:hypothetical protein
MLGGERMDKVKDALTKADTHTVEAYTQQSQLERMSPGFESEKLIEQKRQGVAHHRQMAIVQYLKAIAYLNYEIGIPYEEDPPEFVQEHRPPV